MGETREEKTVRALRLLTRQIQRLENLMRQEVFLAKAKVQVPRQVDAIQLQGREANVVELRKILYTQQDKINSLLRELESSADAQ